MSIRNEGEARGDGDGDGDEYGDGNASRLRDTATSTATETLHGDGYANEYGDACAHGRARIRAGGCQLVFSCSRLREESGGGIVHVLHKG